MANWTGFSMTSRGAELQAKVNAGSTTLTFTKLALGSGEAEGSLENLTELVHKEMDITIKSISNEGNIVTLRSTITNKGISQAFYAREMGLYATDPDLGEILYAIQTDPKPDNIPAEGSATVVSEDFTAHLIMSNTGSVSAVLDTGAFATLEDLDAHNAAEDAHPYILQKITDDINTHDANESAHQKAFEKHNKDESAHPFLLKKITTDIAAHNTAINAHSNFDWVKTMSAASDGLHFRTRNASADTVLNLINTLQATLNQGTVPSGNSGTILALLSGIVHQIKALSGKTNWWEAPKGSFETLSACIVAGDVNDQDAWWVKFGGTIPLVIQGGLMKKSEVVFPVAFSNKALIAWRTILDADPSDIHNGIVFNTIGINNLSKNGYSCSYLSEDYTHLFGAIGF